MELEIKRDFDSVQVTIDGAPFIVPNVLHIQTERAYCLIGKFRELLGPEGLIDLFAEESRQTEDFLLDVLAKSTPGKYKTAVTELYAKNCGVKDFQAAFMGGNLKHPEHMLARPLGGGVNEILEVVVDKYLHFKMNHNPNPDTFPKYETQPDATFVLRGEIATMDDKPFGLYCCHELTEMGDDLKLKACLIMPDAMDDELVNRGKLHLAVEYFNLLSAARQIHLKAANA